MIESAGVLDGSVAEDVDRQAQDQDAEDEKFRDDDDCFGGAEGSEAVAEHRGHRGREREVGEGADRRRPRSPWRSA